MKIVGIDAGGSAFKGAPVAARTGKLLAEKHRVEVNSPCPTARGLAAAREIARHFKWRGPVGVGFPSIILGDRIGAVGNLGHNWEKKNGAVLFGRATRGRVKMITHADAPGLPDINFAAGRGRKGSVLLLTF